MIDTVQAAAENYAVISRRQVMVPSPEEFLYKCPTRQSCSLTSTPSER